MPTLMINGREVPVGDDFYALSDADKAKRVDDLARTNMIPNPAATPAYNSAVLPYTYDQQGKRTFDPINAGLPSSLARSGWDAFNLPGDVMEAVFTGQPPKSAGVLIDPMTGRPSANMIDRTANLASMMNVTSPANLAGRPSMLVPPTATELKASGATGMDAIRATGMQIDPQAVANSAAGLRNSLQGESRIAINAPGTHGLIDWAEQNRPTNVGDIMALRTRLQEIAVGPDRKDGAAAAIAVRHIDNSLPALQTGDIVGGTATGPEVAARFRTARGDYAAGERANALSGELDDATTGMVERAQAQANATFSGKNFDNALRQRVGAFLTQPSNLYGYSKEEIAMLQAVRDGTATQNQLRNVANLFGGGGGLGRLATIYSGLTGGGLLGGADPLTAAGAAAVALPTIGGISKVLENVLARRSANAADEAIRMRSPMYQTQLARQNPALEVTARDAVVLRTLMPGLLAPPARPETPADKGFI